jgi:hypothetical protein
MTGLILTRRTGASQWAPDEILEHWQPDELQEIVQKMTERLLSPE